MAFTRSLKPLVNSPPHSTTFLFKENPLPILYPISYVLTYAIRDDAILVNGYTSLKPFFTIDLKSQNVKAIKVY